MTIVGGPVYGLGWNKTTDVYTRLTSAAGLMAGTAFDSLSGGAWGLRRCNLWDGTVTAYYGDRCYTDADVVNMGQAMVEIPKFYYYMEYDAATTSYYWFVTTTEATTIDTGVGLGPQPVKIHPAFSRSGVVKDNIYLGAYAGYYNTTTSMLESKANVAPKVSQTRATFRGYAQARGAGWTQSDYLTRSATQLLYLIEYGDFHAGALLGGGLRDTTYQNTGLTTSAGNASYGAPDNVHAMSYRGIENWYGNYLEWTDGINIQADYKVWVADHNFADDTFDGTVYTDTGLTVGGTNAQYISDIDTNATYDYGFIPRASAAYEIGYKGLWSALGKVTGNRVVRHGAAAVGGSAAGHGAFYFSCINAAADVSVGTTARLLYVG